MGFLGKIGSALGGIVNNPIINIGLNMICPGLGQMLSMACAVAQAVDQLDQGGGKNGFKKFMGSALKAGVGQLMGAAGQMAGGAGALGQAMDTFKSDPQFGDLTKKLTDTFLDTVTKETGAGKNMMSALHSAIDSLETGDANVDSTARKILHDALDSARPKDNA